MESARDVAVLLLVPLAGLAMLDGLYIHLWRLRLHARPESRREHLLHTARALLFPPTLLLLYGFETAGWLLWLGTVLGVADTALEAWDTFEEPGSRRALGGLTSGEALLHVTLVTLRAGSLALVLASQPSAAWLLDAGVRFREVEPWQGLLVRQGLLPGSVLVALLHVTLAWWARDFRVRHAA